MEQKSILASFTLFLAFTLTGGAFAASIPEASSDNTVKLKNIADKYIDGWFTNKQNERQTLYEMSMLGATNFKVDYFMPCAKFRGTKKIAGKIVDVTGKKCISFSYTYKGKTIETGECRPFKTAPNQGQ